MIGPQGGTVGGPDGVQVIVPPGALSQPTTIGIARNSAGAPAAPTGNPAVGSAYEFTPHDLVFNKPVTLRMPVPAGAVGSELFMASPGADWEVVQAAVTGRCRRMAAQQLLVRDDGRCLRPSGAQPQSRPLPCVYPMGSASVSATPAAAITRTGSSNPNGNAGSWAVNEAGTVSITLNYRAAPDCGVGTSASSGQVKLVRWNNAVSPRVVQTVFDAVVPLTPTPMPLPPGSFSDGNGGPAIRGVGSTTIDISAYLTDAVNVFGFSFACARPGKPLSHGGDVLTFIGALPAPPGPFTIGGTVSGLTGAGLVLQNNGGDNLAVPANATSFTFAASVANSTPYSVSVLAQPAGQTCTVQNGRATATANVTNVAIACVSFGRTRSAGGHRDGCGLCQLAGRRHRRHRVGLGISGRPGDRRLQGRQPVGDAAGAGAGTERRQGRGAVGQRGQRVRAARRRHRVGLGRQCPRCARRPHDDDARASREGAAGRDHADGRGVLDRRRRQLPADGAANRVLAGPACRGQRPVDRRPAEQHDHRRHQQRERADRRRHRQGRARLAGGPVRELHGAPDAANSAGAAFFVTNQGDRYVWGANGTNLLGAGPSTLFAGGAAGPVPPPNGLFWSGIGRVELGRDFAVALDENLGLVAVGRNVEGQLGNGSTTSNTSLVKVGTLANVSDFSVGQTSAAAITNGQLWAWGWNGSAAVTTPTRVGTGTGFTKVVVGDIHSLAIGPGGEIYSWGDSSLGALGRSGSAGTPTVVMRP